MKCSICGAAVVPGAQRCPTCGCRYRFRNPDGSALSPFDPNYVPPARKRRTWLWVVIPLVLVFLFLLGCIAFSVAALLSGTQRIGALMPEAAISAQPDPSAPASEDCFLLADGVLLFRPELYDGGPVLQVPETVGGQTVTIIGPGCFNGCEELTTIVLPDTVTGIQSGAFAGCGQLRGLFLPETTRFIGQDAFEGCDSLEAIYIPSAVDAIEPGVFDDCASLRFIFYSGMYENWTDLYSDYITPFTYVLCLDGDYYHGAQ